MNCVPHQRKSFWFLTVWSEKSIFIIRKSKNTFCVFYRIYTKARARTIASGWALASLPSSNREEERKTISLNRLSAFAIRAPWVFGKFTARAIIDTYTRICSQSVHWPIGRNENLKSIWALRCTFKKKSIHRVRSSVPNFGPLIFVDSQPKMKRTRYELYKNKKKYCPRASIADSYEQLHKVIIANHFSCVAHTRSRKTP